MIQKWVEAEAAATEIAARPEGFDSAETKAASIKRGRELFYGPIANCVKCHGDSALGDGQTSDYDDWTKELGLPKTDDLRAVPPVGGLGTAHDSAPQSSYGRLPRRTSPDRYLLASS